MRIAYFVHGRGRGHASRSSAVLHRLREAGHEVTLFAGGDALDMLRGTAGLMPVSSVAPGSGLVRRTASRVRHDVQAMRSLRPDRVVSDGDMPSMLAAARLGIPSLAIGHDLVFSRCRLPATLCRRALAKQRVNAFHTSLARAGVAVNFLPVEAAHASFVVARPDVRAELAGGTGSDGPIVAYFRDANGARVLGELVRAGERVVLFGARFEAPAGVEVAPFDVGAFARALASARAVVGSSGSNLLAECVALGKPLLAMHEAGDAEQRLNGDLLEAAGAGVAVPFSTPDLRAVVRRFLARVDQGRFSRPDMRSMTTASEAMLTVMARA